MAAVKKIFSHYGRYFFLAAVITDIALILLQAEEWRIFSKPLLMPLLALYVWAAGSNSLTGKWLIIAGLIFSAAGDTFLLFEKDYPIMFIAGLSCFLLTHILYVIYFVRAVKKGPSLLRKNPLIIVAVIIYLAGFSYLLFPKLGGLKIPVFIYTLIIGGMLLASLDAYLKLPVKSAFRFALGALFFVISDSLLAFNKFFHSIPQAGLLIMLTYCLAQFLIAEGYIFAGKER